MGYDKYVVCMYGILKKKTIYDGWLLDNMVG